MFSWKTLLLCLPLIATVPVTPTVSGQAICWDTRTLRLVAAGGGYARMIRLSSGDLLCCYEHQRSSWVRRSTDEGQSWSEARHVASCSVGTAANPEMIQLRGGRLLFCYNQRPNQQHGDSAYAILITTSDDDGLSWSPSRTVFTAVTVRRCGCWEPRPVQYPDGKIHIYFANEFPYEDSHEQEISILCSRFNSKSKKKAVRWWCMSETRRHATSSKRAFRFPWKRDASVCGIRYSSRILIPWSPSRRAG